MVVNGVFFHDHPGFHYYEGRAGTRISILFLFLTGAINFWIFLRQRDQIIWPLIGFGFAFLAFDEWLMIHERLDIFIHDALGIEETGLTDRIDDMLIGAYGLIGLFFLYLHRDAIFRYEVLPRFLKIGFVFLILTVLLDTATNHNGGILAWVDLSPKMTSEIASWLGALEDVCKLMGGAAFLAGFFEVLKQVENVPAKSARTSSNT